MQSSEKRRDYGASFFTQPFMFQYEWRFALEEQTPRCKEVVPLGVAPVSRVRLTSSHLQKALHFASLGFDEMESAEQLGGAIICCQSSWMQLECKRMLL